MKALIFNSGIGKRMGDLTQSRHKSMVSLGNGETILGRQVRILADKGIREFVITTGAFGEQLKDVCENFRATQASDLKFYFVENPKYQETNYIYSMYLAGEYLDDDFLMLHGDLVFNEDLVAMVLESERASTCLINREKTLPEKDFKGRVRDELLKEVSIIGLIELPDSMFVSTKPKIIIVMQKRIMDRNKCFMVKLPSFTDVKDFNGSLMDIEAWFENNNYNNRSEEN